MFKYISSILEKFSKPQRIMALLLLLLTITIISVGPSITKNLKSSCDELKLRIKSQEEQITELTIRVNQRNKEVLDNQKECTEQLILKEKEIVAEVDKIINEQQNHKHLIPLKNFDKNFQPIQNEELINKLVDLKNKYQQNIQSH
jgi:hypothetical protein